MKGIKIIYALNHSEKNHQNLADQMLTTEILETISENLLQSVIFATTYLKKNEEHTIYRKTLSPGR